MKTIYGGFAMRAVEEKIIQALRGCSGEGLKKLSCRDSVEVDGGTRKYWLWDSLLFWNEPENVYCFSARGWSSITTKSRLSQILGSFCNAGICQKNCEWFLEWNGKKYPVDSESVFMLKGNKLYKKAEQCTEILPL